MFNYHLFELRTGVNFPPGFMYNRSICSSWSRNPSSFF